MIVKLVKDATECPFVNKDTKVILVQVCDDINCVYNIHHECHYKKHN